MLANILQFQQLHRAITDTKHRLITKTNIFLVIDSVANKLLLMLLHSVFVSEIRNMSIGNDTQFIVEQ